MVKPFLVTRQGGAGLKYHQTLALHAPTRGVRSGTEWHEELQAFGLVLPSGTVFSHTTAAHVQGLPLDDEPGRPHHVTSDTTAKRGRRKGLIWHHRALPDIDRDRWHGLDVTSPLRTWRDLGGELSLVGLVVIADVLLRRGLATRAQLWDVDGRYHGRLLGRAAALADGGSQSPEETKMRLEILARGLPAPTLNDHIIEEGEWVGCGDFVWRHFKVIADYDGAHHESPRQRHQDAQTRDDYAANGWRHVVLTSAMTREQAVDRIERALRERGWRA